MNPSNGLHVRALYRPDQRVNPVRLQDPRPVERQQDLGCTGDAGKDGYSVLVRSRPGDPPGLTNGQEHNHQSPSWSWEQ
jgi:hypothetical protein